MGRVVDIPREVHCTFILPIRPHAATKGGWHILYLVNEGGVGARTEARRLLSDCKGSGKIG